MVEQILGRDLRVDAEVLRQVAEHPPHRVLVAQHVDVAQPRRVPASASCSVASVRISVDLPAPFGPSRPNMPVGIVSETSVERAHAVGVGLGQAGDRQGEGHRGLRRGRRLQSPQASVRWYQAGLWIHARAGPLPARPSAHGSATPRAT